jgi:LysM repeat protein
MEENTMSKRKTNLSLVGYAISRLGTGYVYGTYGHVLTESLLTAKLKQYPLKVMPYLSFIRANWLGKPVQDCVGLIKGHYWTNDDGKIIYRLDGLPDVSANGLYNAATEKGPIATLPEIKGIIVSKSGHVGIYIGNGEVIEAHGTKSGVIKTRLTRDVNETGWTRWFKCPFIDYVSEDKSIYVVQRGESLWSIARRLLGDGRRYLELAALNGITAPYTIYAGQVLQIDGVRLYTVKDGDSPWRIAQVLLGDGRRYQEIVEQNGLKEPYIIYTGQILKIPNK